MENSVTFFCHNGQCFLVSIRRSCYMFHMNLLVVSANGCLKQVSYRFALKFQFLHIYSNCKIYVEWRILPCMQMTQELKNTMFWQLPCTSSIWFNMSFPIEADVFHISVFIFCSLIIEQYCYCYHWLYFLFQNQVRLWISLFFNEHRIFL